MKSLFLVIFLIAIAYIVFTRWSNVRIERFTESSDSDSSDGSYTVLDTSTETRPYVTTEDKWGDFEQDFVYGNEGGANPSQDAINAARRRFPFDWSQLPPSSSLYQAQQALFVKDADAQAAPFVKETFTTIDAEKILPPDVDAEEEKVNDMLKQYHTNSVVSLKATDDQGVEKLIQDIYGSKGLIPRVAKKANNVYEVYETVEKNPKIVWEDEVQSSIQSNELNPILPSQELLAVPAAVGDVAVGLAPRASGESTAQGRQTYSDYNPNLEGIFGPSMMMQQWG